MKAGVKTLGLLATIFFATNTHAQIVKPGVMVGGNLQYAKPSGDFRNTHNYGLGAEAFAGVGLGKTFLVGTIGISSFHSTVNEVGNITYIPMKLGVRQFLFGRTLFVNADLGSGKVKVNGNSDKRFLVGFGAGARFLGVEAQVYFDGWKNQNSTAFSNSMLFKVGTSLVL